MRAIESNITRNLLVLAAVLTLAGCGSLGLFWRQPPVYAVFFDAHDVTLTPDGRKIVDDAATAARLDPKQIVEISGPSTKATPGYDPGLAETRIHLVEQTLIGDGVAPNRMFRAPSPIANVKAGASGAQRVEIRLRDAPGS
jgi:outer membrane protein OmpA-like peptidoglycan-associated protein